MKLVPIIITALLFALNSCSSQGDLCECWKEMITRSSEANMSKSCAYILDMQYGDIESGVDQNCLDEIKKLTYDEVEFELDEEFNEDALFEGDDFF
jgi:hypothetical protein